MFSLSGSQITNFNILLDIQNALIETVRNPSPGQWKFVISSRGPHTIRMTGRSSVDFTLGFSPDRVLNKEDIRQSPIKGEYILNDICEISSCSHLSFGNNKEYNVG